MPCNRYFSGGVLTSSTPSYAGNVNFVDLPSTHWAYEPVTRLANAGIINGYPNSTFRPNETVTYAEFIKMVYVAMYEENLNGLGYTWAYPYFDKAIELGWCSEDDLRRYGKYISVYNKYSNSNQKIPRSAMALICANAINAAEIEDYDAVMESLKDVDVNTRHSKEIVKSYTLGILTSFDDVHMYTEDAYKIYQAYQEGIISGYPDGTFKPEGTLTRAEAAVVILRLIDKTKRIIPEIEIYEEGNQIE